MLCTVTYLTRWKERGTIRFIPELVHNLASAFALRASMMMKKSIFSRWWRRTFFWKIFISCNNAERNDKWLPICLLVWIQNWCNFISLFYLKSFKRTFYFRGNAYNYNRNVIIWCKRVFRRYSHQGIISQPLYDTSWLRLYCSCLYYHYRRV